MVVVATTAMSRVAPETTLVLPQLDHYQPHFPQSVTAMAIDVIEVHIVSDFQDAWAWRPCSPSLSLCQIDLRLASQLDHNHPVFSAAMW
jgi:hypothetical protein